MFFEIWQASAQLWTIPKLNLGTLAGHRHGPLEVDRGVNGERHEAQREGRSEINPEIGAHVSEFDETWCHARYFSVGSRLKGVPGRPKAASSRNMAPPAPSHAQIRAMSPVSGLVSERPSLRALGRSPATPRSTSRGHPGELTPRSFPEVGRSPHELLGCMSMSSRIGLALADIRKDRSNSVESNPGQIWKSLVLDSAKWC